MFAFKTIGNNLDLPRDKYLRDRNASVRRGGRSGGQTCERCSTVLHNTWDKGSKIQVVHSPFRKCQLFCSSVKVLQNNSIPIQVEDNLLKCTFITAFFLNM